jgi:hypothetical protein
MSIFRTTLGYVSLTNQQLRLDAEIFVSANTFAEARLRANEVAAREFPKWLTDLPQWSPFMCVMPDASPLRSPMFRIVSSCFETRCGFQRCRTRSNRMRALPLSNDEFIEEFCKCDT